MNIISGIYMIKSPENILYIGASNNIKRRWAEHVYRPRTMKESFNKYGAAAHELHILYYLPEDATTEVRNTYEKLYIERHLECGFTLFNSREGGTNGKLSDAQKNAIRNTLLGRYFGEKNPNYGRKLSEEAKKKIGDANRGKSPRKGEKLSDDTRKKMSIAAKKRHNK